MVKTLKFLLKISVTLILLIVILLFSLSYYLEQHKQDLFSKFENWYHENHHGQLSFDDLSISTFRNFPNVALKIENLVISDTISEQNKTELLKIADFRLLVSLKNILNKEVEIKALKLSNGVLNIITEKNGNSNKPIFNKKKNDTLKNNSQQKWFTENGIAISIEDFEVTIIDFQKNKRITGTINDIYSKLTFQDNIINSDIEMDVQMHEMGLNLYRGTFFNDAHLVGEYKATFNKEEQTITVPSFILNIDAQKFKTTSSFSTIGEGSFDISLENPKTDILATTHLLSQNIQKKLIPFKLSKPVYTFATLQGSFKFRSNPFVNVYLSTANNTITKNDSIQFDNVTLKGSFVNRAYDDERALNENVKNLRIKVDELTGSYKNIPFLFKKAALTSTPKFKNWLAIDLNVEAPTTTLNELFNNEQFLFSEGNYKFNANFEGDVIDLKSAFDQAKSSLAFSKTKIIYTPHSLEIPIDTIHLDLKNKNAVLNVLKIPITGSKHNIILTGTINNVSSLVIENGEQVKSEFNVYSDALVWEDFLYLFKMGTNKNISQQEKQDLLYLNEALKALYIKFNPQLKISIKEFQYQNLIINELTTGLQFVNVNAIDVNKTGFNYKNGFVALSLNLDITKPNTTGFDLEFIAKDIDFGSLLKEFDYFSLSSLKNAKKVAGKTSIDVIMKGVIDEQNGLDTKSLAGSIEFELNNLELDGFEPIQKIGDKIFRKERFENIKFGPISETIYIANKTVTIPQMEIQSTAFDLFVEGELNYENKTHIWVSIPLSNLKKRKDLINIPKNKGYFDAGKKVFVEVKDEGTGELTYKFHLTNKKLYEQRGLLENYKIDKKDERKIKRAEKKKERLLKRESKKQ